MFYLLLFLSEIALLFFLSKKLINNLAQLFFKFISSHKAVVNILSILFLPGTIIHELSHLLIAGVLLVPVGEISVVPEIEERGVKLGSVQIGQTDPFRKMLVGVAPILVGITSILGILYFAQIDQSLALWQIVLNLYLIFEIGNTMFSSKKDLEGILGFLAILTTATLALGALYIFNPDLVRQSLSYFNQLNFETVINFFKKASAYLLVPLSLDLMIIILTASFLRR